MRSRVAIMFPLLLAVCALAQAGDYYKWTDAQGTVHYSQTPPPDRASKSVYVSDGAPVMPLAGTGGTPATPEQKAKAQANQAAVQKANTQAVAGNCATAQQNISTLQGRRPVVKGDGDPAQAHALDPQAREQALADAQKQAATYCTKKP
jgi:hypothetical protein